VAKIRARFKSELLRRQTARRAMKHSARRAPSVITRGEDAAEPSKCAAVQSGSIADAQDDEPAIGAFD
jgi:hypothetical protein